MDPMSYTDWFIRILLVKKTQANQLSDMEVYPII